MSQLTPMDVWKTAIWWSFYTHHCLLTPTWAELRREGRESWVERGGTCVWSHAVQLPSAVTPCSVSAPLTSPKAAPRAVLGAPRFLYWIHTHTHTHSLSLTGKQKKQVISYHNKFSDILCRLSLKKRGQGF